MPIRHSVRVNRGSQLKNYGRLGSRGLKPWQIRKQGENDKKSSANFSETIAPLQTAVAAVTEKETPYERGVRIYAKLQSFLSATIRDIARRKRVVHANAYHLLKLSSTEIRIYRISQVGAAVYQELLPLLRKFAKANKCTYHRGMLKLA